jgi:serine/threonine protein kinase
MNPAQEEAKKRIIIVVKLINYKQSADYLFPVLQERLEIIQAISRSHFALPIPSVCLRIAHALLFSAFTETIISYLGSGSMGDVQASRVMGQICAKKILKDPTSTELECINRGIKTAIQFSSPYIALPYHHNDKMIYFECGVTNLHEITRTCAYESDFLPSLPTYVEDMLLGLSTLHLGFKKIRRCIVKTCPLPSPVVIVTNPVVYHALSKESFPIVHRDVKSPNFIFSQRTSERRNCVKIIDLDSLRNHHETVIRVDCTYESISPDAASIYKNPTFTRQVSIYDDSWALGSSLYKFMFNCKVYDQRSLTALSEIMSQVETITQELIDSKLQKFILPQWILLGQKAYEAALSYFESKHPGNSLSQAQLEDLKRKLAFREVKRQIQIIRGLLTVNVAHRLTPDEAHNIYYMAERKLRCIKEQDFDDPIPYMETELNFLNQNLYKIPLKIEPTVKRIQKAYRKYLSRKRASP